ncbi:MAG: EscU/YscU/HrcU family type III secretion system export apparatus switch protein [Planctomycetaceae bacterium]|nr:EscU/YscU/HrcU family type III secretion system export apparatus switch protein [Planctomycetaceae bacterium]
MNDPHEQKFFPASSRKRRQARDNGQVVVSPDLLAGVFLLAVTLILQISGHQLLDDTGTYLRGSLDQIQTTSPENPSDLSEQLLGLFGSSARYFLGKLWPIWSLSLLAVVVVLMQTRGLIHWATLKPDLQRISPANGLQKYSPAEIWRRTLTVSIKLTGLSLIAWTWGVKQHELESQATLSQQTSAGFEQAISFLGALAGGMIVWGVVDYIWRRIRFERQLRMSAREVADEQQQFDPDPNIRQNSQRLREKFSSSLSLNPETDLFITNGMAEGVLLRYQPEIHAVPMILVRESGSAGVILLQRCLQRRIPIHESTSLQQSLFQPADSLLPQDLWPEVANIYAKYASTMRSQPFSAEPVSRERVEESEV